MTNIRSFLSKTQLQYRRTPTLHKVVVAAAIVLSSVTLFTLRLVQWESEEQAADLHPAAKQRGTASGYRRTGHHRLHPRDRAGGAGSGGPGYHHH